MLSMKYFMLYFFKCVLMFLKKSFITLPNSQITDLSKKLKSIYLCQAFSVKGCRWQQGFHTESCEQGNASVTLMCLAARVGVAPASCFPLPARDGGRCGCKVCRDEIFTLKSPENTI